MPPSQLLNLDIEAISGICGSVSIACWIVVFSPQIIEQWKRRSADSLSIRFIIVWLLGDVFNILGGWLQGILPTMMILAVYYTIADLVLLCQCFYYRGFTLTDLAPKDQRQLQRDERRRARCKGVETGTYTERTHMLGAQQQQQQPNGHGTNNDGQSGSRDESRHRRQHASSHEWSSLSPVAPHSGNNAIATAPPAPPTAVQSIIWNTSIIIMVYAAGVAGWALGRKVTASPDHAVRDAPELEFNVLGQVFGYLCAMAYIGSRLPQLILNHRRRSTDGLSMLFFLFACLGNVTYVMSILAHRAPCSRCGDCQEGDAVAQYGRYILVNASWLAGSLLTLLLDMGVFAQYFVYNDNMATITDADNDVDDAMDDEVDVGKDAMVARDADEMEQFPPLEAAMSSDSDETETDMRPLLRRGDSTY